MCCVCSPSDVTTLLASRLKWNTQFLLDIFERWLCSARCQAVVMTDTRMLLACKRVEWPLHTAGCSRSYNSVTFCFHRYVCAALLTGWRSLWRRKCLFHLGDGGCFACGSKRSSRGRCSDTESTFTEWNPGQQLCSSKCLTMKVARAESIARSILS